MHKEEISIAKAKAHFSELINKVIYGHEEIIITKRGNPVAILTTPMDKGLYNVKGWLDEKDPFLTTLVNIENKRHVRKLRISKTHNK